MATKVLIAYGYIRLNLDENCWIDGVTKIIIEYYMNRDGSLYVFGFNMSGCLGIQNCRDNVCTEPTVCLPFVKENPLDVAVGYSHTLVLDIDGNVWTCGNGKDGQLGNAKQRVSILSKLLTQSVIAVAAGQDHSLILLKNGHLQTFGSGTYGQLGHGNDTAVFIPKTVETLTNYQIIQIAAGARSSCLLTSNGSVFCFGENEEGECGVGNGKGTKILVPTKADVDVKIDLIESGGWHSLLISKDRCIYSFGFGDLGRLGHGNTESKYSPTLIEKMKKIRVKKCAAGQYHSLCVVEERGLVLAWGMNVSGQCGLSSKIKVQQNPKGIEYFLSNKIRAIDCCAGGNSSSVIAEDGSLYVFGSNLKCQLGITNAQHAIFTPTKLPLPQNMFVQKVSIGHQHTALIAEQID